PLATTTHYEFPARDQRAPVELLWYDGGLKPPRPQHLPDGEWLESGGTMYVGSKGTLLHMNGIRLLTAEGEVDLPEVPRLFDRIEGESHENNWLRAIRGEEEATSPFSFAVPLTEAVLLGVVSLKAGNRKLHWDPDAMRVTNLPD